MMPFSHRVPPLRHSGDRPSPAPRKAGRAILTRIAALNSHGMATAAATTFLVLVIGLGLLPQRERTTAQPNFATLGLRGPLQALPNGAP